MEPNGVADLGLRYQRRGKHVNNLVSCVLVICLVPNLIHQHDVSRFQLDMLQFICIFPGKFNVKWIYSIIFIIGILEGLRELIVEGEVSCVVGNPVCNLV